MKYIIPFINLLLFSCSQPPHESSPQKALSKEIDSYLQESVNRHSIAGLTIAATRNDSVVYTGVFGFRNIDTKEPMKVNCDFHWASVSKTFVATAIMQLVEKGKINLDEKLIAYVPYFKQSAGAYKEITIRQMLNHTSGIGDVDDYEWEKPQNDEGAPERYVKSLENDKMRFSPGKDFAYSNTAFEILGVVISRVSGMPFETYMRRNIFDPLEMDHTSFIYAEIPDSLRVKGHLWANKPIVSKVYPYNRIHAPSSTLNSNVLDMTHYAMANLHRGKYKDKQILSDSSYRLLWTNSVNIEGKSNVGLSWFLDEYKGLKIVSHGGGDTGFRSYLLLVPEKNISIEVACNYEFGTKDLAFAVLDFLLGENPKVIKQPIGFAVAPILAAEGIEKAKAFYYEMKKDSIKSKGFIWSDYDGMAYPAYVLLEQGMLKEALEFCKLHQELNPKSGHAYGVLGIAYARLGDKKLAEFNLKKSIELLPSEEFYKEELNKLKK